ncbi:MAG TPA: LpxD N-terminal domain-containing protein, partial [Telmatospirillum sp.]|nr:LpxD N-terminal domain-containing protein [Telmatospirillum sp.]
MADPRFFAKAGPFALAELARWCGAELADATNPDAVLHDVAPLDKAGPSDLSFLDNKKYVEAFTVSHAGACLVHPSLAARAPDGMALLLSDDPYRAYAKVAAAFYPRAPLVPGVAVG